MARLITARLRSPAHGAVCQSACIPRKAFAGSRVSPHRRSKPSLRRASYHKIENNELNKWGDRDAREDDSDNGELDDGFERDTMKTMLRILTARATQKVLMQLQELDIHVATWLSEFCSREPPTKGDDFLLALMKEASSDLIDKTNQTSHSVSPADLCDRILLTRTDMATRISKTFPGYVQRQGTELKIRHLSNSYVSGTTGGRGGTRRQR